MRDRRRVGQRPGHLPLFQWEWEGRSGARFNAHEPEDLPAVRIRTSKLLSGAEPRFVDGPNTRQGGSLAWGQCAPRGLF